MKNNDLLKLINQSIISQLGDITDRVILFGSRTRETFNDSSDYDILVILNRDIDWQLEWKIYDICYDISLDKEILIDVKVISSAELQTIRGRQPYVQDAIDSGVAYDTL
ncbi:MAG TPA: nucleotidyltransferase domain-containing protein [Spirochaetota bacterium]|nr:nucleotidyltransferase domain-containing protein [Spirochaetota bacterium]